MKQATGNNALRSAKKVSIQLTLDGHSFSPDEAGALTQGATVDVELLSPRTMLIPQEFFDAEHAGELLAAAGMAAAEGERVVWSDASQKTVAVMAMDAGVLDALEKQLGATPRYTTPLLREIPTVVPTVWMYNVSGLLYTKVYDGTLRFAGVIPAPGDGDLLYFMARLGGEFELEGYELRLTGDNAKTLRKLLKGYFKQIVCE